MNSVKKLFEKITLMNRDQVYKMLGESLDNSKRRVVVTINSELFRNINDDELYTGLMSEDTTVVVDGISVIKTADYIGYKEFNKIPGVEIVEALLEQCHQKSLRLATVGASTEVLEMFKSKIESDYSGIDYIKQINGYSANLKQQFIDLANEGPDVILVALGVPLQEKMIFETLEFFNKGVFVGCGGSIDVLSGYKKRAPIFFQKLNLEWFYRAVSEPYRFKRYFDGGIALIKVIKLYRREQRVEGK